MSNPFVPNKPLPPGTTSLLLGAHTNKRDLTIDMHAIIGGKVFCSDEANPHPVVYVRVNPDTVRQFMLPITCEVCRSAVAHWAGKPEWAELPASKTVVHRADGKRGAS